MKIQLTKRNASDWQLEASEISAEEAIKFDEAVQEEAYSAGIDQWICNRPSVHSNYCWQFNGVDAFVLIYAAYQVSKRLGVPVVLGPIGE